VERPRTTVATKSRSTAGDDGDAGLRESEESETYTVAEGVSVEE
jgi:hypothetical protein